MLLRRKIYQPTAGWGRFLAQLAVANTAVVTYLFYVVGDVAFWLDKPAVARLGLLLAHVSVALIIYVLSLGACGMRPAQFRGQMKEF